MHFKLLASNNRNNSRFSYTNVIFKVSNSVLNNYEQYPFVEQTVQNNINLQQTITEEINPEPCDEVFEVFV